MKIKNEMDFINDERVIGKWKNIGWFSGADYPCPRGLNDKSGDFNDLYFLSDGEGYWIFESWTKGVLLIHYGGAEPVLTYRYDIILKNWSFSPHGDLIQKYMN